MMMMMMMIIRVLFTVLFCPYRPALSQYFPSHLLPATGGVKSKLLGKGSKSNGIENDLVTGYESIWLKVNPLFL